MGVFFENLRNVKRNHFDKVVSGDDMRPVLQGILIDLENLKMVCTDAHILIEYPIEINEEKSDKDWKKFGNKIVPTELFDQRKYMGIAAFPKKMAGEVEFALEEDFAKVYYFGQEVFKCEYIEGNFPNYKAVYPEKESKENINHIGLNLRIVQDLAEAIPGSSHKDTKLNFFGKHKAIVFENKDSLGEIKGLIMPIMLND